MTPLGIAAIAGAILAVVAYVRRSARPRRVTFQFTMSLVSWALLWFAAASSFSRRGMVNLPDHMIGHVIVMFIVPMGLIGSASVRSLWWVLGVSQRRRLLRWWYVGRQWRLPTWVANPLVAAVVLNVVMVSAHVPRVFDAVMEHTWAMDWLMEPAFLISGLFFFHFLIPAVPRRIRTRLRAQLFMVLFTMLEMLIMAMAMSIFTKAAWYSVMIAGSGAMSGMNMPGAATSTAQAFHQQQLAAAILWICGDFCAVPCLVLITRRLVMREGSLFAALDRQSERMSGSSL